MRAAMATTEDGLMFARLIDEAQEGVFRVMLGTKAHDLVAAAFLRPAHDLSHEHVTFAELEGRIVGMASGYTAEAHAHFTDELRRVTTGWRRYRAAAFTRLAARTLRFISTVPTGDFYVRGLAVEPAHRSAGIGTALLGELEESARAAGSERLALDVAAKNRGARRLYDRVGMTAEAESPRWFGLPNTNLIRMTKLL
jgi:ribosomal protein S18 acetylase RimI-like enzyme